MAKARKTRPSGSQPTKLPRFIRSKDAARTGGSGRYVMPERKQNAKRKK